MGDSSTQVPGLPFVLKTFQILSDKSHAHIISWSESGTSFVIHQPADFASQLLPKHFKHSNISSFIRQLNTYRFQRVQSSQRLEFSHEFFLEHRPELLCRVCRIGSTNKRLREPADEAQAALDEEKAKLAEDIARLEQSANPLTEELARLRQVQRAAAVKLQRLTDEAAAARQERQQMHANIETALATLLGRAGPAATGHPLAQLYDLLYSRTPSFSGLLS
eukprot:TRINITY_DN18335_c0_g1_i1.p1 TRINITY_DN18335_c0_g1~~TRINITY_DN18335_c0_g1_i1.p1  ORF type:complete len:221 (+),score=61.67 TRINITY_DN18335_c0_g1_i1:102-764(+)